jgi:hypothetical protein
MTTTDPGYYLFGGLPSSSTVLINSFLHSWQEKVCNSKSGILAAGVRRMTVIVPEHSVQGSLSAAPKRLPGVK